MADDAFNWPCPACTVYNTYQAQACSVCGYNLASNRQRANRDRKINDNNKNITNQIKDLKLYKETRQQQGNGIGVSNNSYDIGNNNGNESSKYTGMFKSAFNTLSNDIKNFVNGLSPNGKNKNAYDYTDNPDVIEIDPITNKPVRFIHSDLSSNQNGVNKKNVNSTTMKIDKSSNKHNQWTCRSCTFADNPDWSAVCEICQSKRNDRKNTLQDENNENEPTRNDRKATSKSHDEEASNLTVYDISLNEDIYDYARIWTCAKCTYINFKKDKECELCLTPRHVSFSSHQEQQQQLAKKTSDNKILNESNANSKSNSKSSQATSSKAKQIEQISNVAGNKWVCSFCTYINSNAVSNCALCSNININLKNKSNNRNGEINNNEWRCEICFHKNKSSENKCIVCLNIKDSMNFENSQLNGNNFDNNDDEDEIDAIYYNNYNNMNKKNNNTFSPSTSTFRSQKAKSIMKTYTNATCQAEIIWNNIVKYCKQQNIKFVDDSFPPCDKSLFIDPNTKPENLQLRGIKWLSPEHIRTHHDEQNSRWTVYNEPKFSDIKQGLLGNCWLLSGLAVIIEKPEMLRRIIITKEYCPQGCYQVRLCHNGEWQTVIVDDLFPCDFNDCLIYSQASRKQLWVPLIEKAMAKLNGNYESLIAGQTVEGLATLTGYPCDSIRLEPSSSANEDDIDLEMIWARIVSMKDYGYCMGASCGRTDMKNDLDFTSRGLLPRHAYSVLNVKEINGNQLIQLRNPWGRYTWTGDWSDNSPKWTPELRKQFGIKAKKHNYLTSAYQGDNHFYNHNHRSGSDQGVFWMSFNDFVQYFCSIDICKTRLDWYENRMNGYFNPEGTREMQAYHLIVFETSEIDIGLFHKTNKNRRENSDLDLCFVVLRTNGQRNSVGKFIFSSKHSVRKFIGCEHIFEPGEYIIVPFSFNFWYTDNSTANKLPIRSGQAEGASNNINNFLPENNNLYSLVLHSPKVFFLEQEMHAAFLLADTLIRLCISKGSKTSSGLENSCIYTLTKGFAGIVVVAENYNERAYLHVELQCEKSINVVSTRQVLVTIDSVQPLHRQVLIVLTHLEGTTGYSIQYSIKYRLSSNPYLNTWPDREGQMVTNIPAINKQTFGLHAPRSAFD